jgi:hypothetical protein
MDQDRGEIYFIREQLAGGYSEFTKIGLVRERDGRSSADRTKEHQTGNPRLLVSVKGVPTVFVSAVENTLHREFASRRILPGEWFRLDDQTLQQAISRCETLAAAYGASIPMFEEAERLKGLPSSSDLLPASEEAEGWWSTHRCLTYGLKQISNVFTSYKAFLVDAKARGVNVDDYVQISERAGRPTFDKALFQTNYSEIFQSFTVTVIKVNEKFSVTPVKGESFSGDERIAEAIETTAVLAASITRADESEQALDAMHQLYLTLIGLQPSLKKQVEIAEANLQALCGTNAGIETICTWPRLEEAVSETDWDAIKAAHPAERASCTRMSTPSPTVVVNKGSGAESDEG